MLHVWRPSGEEAATFPIESVRNVHELKKRLQELLKVPRIQQRILDGGVVLEDNAQLASTADVQLVLLPLRQVSAEERDFFIQAVFRDYRPTVDDMLRSCHDPNLTGRFRDQHLSPIHAAAKAGHPSMVSLLLEAGAQDVSDAGHQPALAAALERGDTRVLRLLLEAGGDVGRALEAASGAGQQQVVRMLLAQHSDQIPTQAYHASLVAASAVHDCEILWMLLEVDRLGFVDRTWALAARASVVGRWKHCSLAKGWRPRLHFTICAAVFGGAYFGDGVTEGVFTYCLLVGLTTLVVWAFPVGILLLLLWGRRAARRSPATSAAGDVGSRTDFVSTFL
ncbi:ANKS1A [Symbiodinium sp. CCMP2592]|nr:ANKS1A [Symbiodinium sp. CCMP2592]